MSTIHLPANALAILMGPSGCGKSTFARTRFLETQVVSSDGCRRLVSDDPANQAATSQAFAVFHAIIRGRLALGRLTVADATNLQPHARAGLREQAAKAGAPVVVLVLDVPLEVCLEQARRRERHVRPEIILQHHELFEKAKRALPGEGYHAVHTVGPETEIALGPPVQVPGDREPLTRRGGDGAT